MFLFVLPLKIVEEWVLDMHLILVFDPAFHKFIDISVLFDSCPPESIKILQLLTISFIFKNLLSLIEYGEIVIVEVLP